MRRLTDEDRATLRWLSRAVADLRSADVDDALDSAIAWWLIEHDLVITRRPPTPAAGASTDPTVS